MREVFYNKRLLWDSLRSSGDNKNKGMKTNKSLTICQLFGGGNFEPSRLTRTIYAYFSHAKGRLSSFITAVAVVLFVFSVPVLTSCSSDTDDGTEAVDYQSLLSAQEWEVTEACQSFGGFWIDMRESDTFAQFADGNIIFTQGETVNYFDNTGKVTKTEYEIIPLGQIVYTLEGDEIKIGNTIFKITRTTDSLILQSEGWRLVLKTK